MQHPDYFYEAPESPCNRCRELIGKRPWVYDNVNKVFYHRDTCTQSPYPIDFK